jgi:hypothetical protein
MGLFIERLVSRHVMGNMVRIHYTILLERKYHNAMNASQIPKAINMAIDCIVSYEKMGNYDRLIVTLDEYQPMNSIAVDDWDVDEWAKNYRLYQIDGYKQSIRLSVPFNLYIHMTHHNSIVHVVDRNGIVIMDLEIVSDEEDEEEMPELE